MQITKSLGLLLVSSCVSVAAFAAEPIAKEDMTPPPPEGALTAEQIPPIHTLPKPITKPAQPVNVPDSTAPATTIPSAPMPPADLSRPTDPAAAPILNAPIANPPPPTGSSSTTLPPANSSAPTDTVIPIQPAEPRMEGGQLDE